MPSSPNAHAERIVVVAPGPSSAAKRGPSGRNVAPDDAQREARDRGPAGSARPRRRSRRSARRARGSARSTAACFVRRAARARAARRAPRCSPSRENSAQEQLERGVGLRDLELEPRRVLAQEARQVRRRRVRRVELGHRRREEEDAHRGRPRVAAIRAARRRGPGRPRGSARRASRAGWGSRAAARRARGPARRARRGRCRRRRA